MSIDNTCNGLILENTNYLGQQYLKIAIEPLKINPFTNSFRYDEVRFAVTHKFPYTAHYTVDKEKFLVTIHAVFAFKEDPEKWLRDL